MPELDGVARAVHDARKGDDAAGILRGAEDEDRAAVEREPIALLLAGEVHPAFEREDVSHRRGVQPEERAVGLPDLYRGEHSD
ncbi:hypothetical protein [Sorangium sp. So ce145]|uniref:hypothetical protein n=1 Tax=Sorangium sp. So ce145 TaxID=3133285 RepID=UPI003F621400